MTASNNAEQPAAEASRLKNMGLFLLSPFIGLVYAVLLPGKLFQLARLEMKSNAEAKKTTI
jgi:hypothetical protein